MSDHEAWREQAEFWESEARRLYTRTAELEEALKVALDIIGHPDDAMTKRLRATLEKANARSS